MKYDQNQFAYFLLSIFTLGSYSLSKIFGYKVTTTQTQWSDGDSDGSYRKGTNSNCIQKKENYLFLN